MAIKVLSSVGVIALLSGCGVTFNTASNGGTPAHSSSSARSSSTPSQSSSSPSSSTVGSSSSTASSSSPTTTNSPHNTTSQSTHTAVDPQTSWTTGIWYPNRRFAPIAFRIPLPAISGPFVSGPNPYRKHGWYWSSSHMQVAISLVTASLTDFSHAAPNGDHLLTSGGNTGAYAMIWKKSNGTIDANETVSLGSRQAGWPSAFGGSILQDHTFLINITTSNSPANLVLVEKMLARWSVADMNDGATARTDNSRWMPVWPLNPVHNSNYSSLPYWIKGPGSYQ